MEKGVIQISVEETQRRENIEQIEIRLLERYIIIQNFLSIMDIMYAPNTIFQMMPQDFSLNKLI